jgi:hypothetical protein
MSSSRSVRFVGLTAAALSAVALGAGTATAHSVDAASNKGPVSSRCNPSVSITQVTYGLNITGSCFTANGKVRVKILPKTAYTPTLTFTASSTGSFADSGANTSCLAHTQKGSVTVTNVATGWHRTTRHVTIPACKLP